jgi:hypothetical protein
MNIGPLHLFDRLYTLGHDDFSCVFEAMDKLPLKVMLIPSMYLHYRDWLDDARLGEALVPLELVVAYSNDPEKSCTLSYVYRYGGSHTTFLCQ